MSLVKVFVYGTLKPGESNYQRYCSGKVVDICPAIALGELYALGVLGYPAMTTGDRPVRGFLLSFRDPGVLHDLDQLEGYDPHRSSSHNEYDRRQIDVFNIPPSLSPTGGITWEQLSAWPTLGRVWAYFMAPERVRSLGGVLLPTGWWEPNR